MQSIIGKSSYYPLKQFIHKLDARYIFLIQHVLHNLAVDTKLRSCAHHSKFHLRIHIYQLDTHQHSAAHLKDSSCHIRNKNLYNLESYYELHKPLYYLYKFLLIPYQIVHFRNILHSKSLINIRDLQNNYFHKSCIMICSDLCIAHSVPRSKAGKVHYQYLHSHSMDSHRSQCLCLKFLLICKYHN